MCRIITTISRKFIIPIIVDDSLIVLCSMLRVYMPSEICVLSFSLIEVIGYLFLLNLTLIGTMNCAAWLLERQSD